MQDSSRMLRYSRSLLTALLIVAGSVAAHAGDSYNSQTGVLTIPSLAIGGVTYSNSIVKVGTIVSGPSGSSPIGNQDSFNPANGQLTVPAVTVGSLSYYNVVVTVANLGSIGGVTGADSYDGSHLAIAAVQAGNSTYTHVVLAVGLGNVVKIGGGMPAGGQDEFYQSMGQLFIPAVQVGSKVYTNVILNVSAGNLLSVGGASTTPIAAASGGLHNYYVAGTYSTNDAGNADLDQLADMSVGACAAAGTPCNYSAPTVTLSSNGTATGGTESSGTDAGTLASPNSGALTAFQIPTLVSISSANGSAWQGAISLSDIGGELVAMETDANATPGMRFGLVPAQGVSNASLASSFVLAGIATNPSGVAGDEGILDTLQFDGKGGFSGTETTNTWNPTTRTGGIHPSSPAPSGTYAVFPNGSLTLTFASGFNAGTTFTGSLNSDSIVLANLNPAHGPRALLVGVRQPATASETQACTKNPLFGPAFNSGVFETVGVSFNSSVVQQQTFNNGSVPYTLTLDGGTLNVGGTLSPYPSGDSANYTIDSNCFLIVPRQTDRQGNLFEYKVGAVSPSGSVFVLTNFDTSGGGPETSVGVRISNVTQLP